MASQPQRAFKRIARLPWLHAFFGVLATCLGMAVGHFVASLLNPDSSPVLAVGSAIIELTPQPVSSWAIAQFGTADKPILIGSVFAGVLVLAAIAGMIARRVFAVGAAILVVLVALAAAAVLTRPAVEPIDVVPSLLTALTGVAALWWLHRTALGLPLKPRARSTVEVAKAEGAASSVASATPGKRRVVLGDEPVPGDDDTVVISPGATPGAREHSRPTRRGILIVTAALTAATVVLGSAGRLIGGLRARAEDITLPDPAAGEAAKALPADLRATYPGISPLQVANSDFYRVDTRLDTPVVASDGWTLEVGGDVENEFSLSFDELLEMPMVERDITLTCVSNGIGGKYVGGARWLGVPLQTIIDRAKPGSGVDQMIATDFDGMTIGTPYDLLTDGREALLAVGMNGEALPREHGFPARIIVPGLYGFISATKWVTKLDFTTYADTESYWTERGWDTVAPIKPSARIDTPKGLATVKPGKVVVGGVAWAQNDGGVSKVQLKVDGGEWADAQTGVDVNSVYWRQWFQEVELDEGQHTVAARVVDGDGQVQTDAKAQPFPGGSSGIHSLFFTVG